MGALRCVADNKKSFLRKLFAMTNSTQAIHYSSIENDKKNLTKQASSEFSCFDNFQVVSKSIKVKQQSSPHSPTDDSHEFWLVRVLPRAELISIEKSSTSQYHIHKLNEINTFERCVTVWLRPSDSICD